MSKVLIVDDDQSIQHAVKRLLKVNGYDGVEARSGVMALELIEQCSFDLIITDLRMRPVDGLDVLRHSKKATPPTPVIIVTDEICTESTIEAVLLGAFDYLTMPFNDDDLMEVVERAVAYKKASATHFARLAAKKHPEKDEAGRAV